ncbi:MAG: ribonuclease P protein component [Segatella copri]|nr:ribonuclease P protein component [Segatella copri]
MMLTETDNTFGKREHLCKQTLIDQLFSGEAHVMTAWPLKMVYLVVDKTDEQSASVELMVSVSKRFFKRAVKRNRVKRQIREAYRTQKHELMERMAQMPDKQLLLAVIWQDGKLHDSAELNARMNKNLQRLVEKL